MKKIDYSDYEDIELLEEVDEKKTKKKKKIKKKSKNLKKIIISSGIFLFLMIISTVILVKATNLFNNKVTDDKKEPSKNLSSKDDLVPKEDIKIVSLDDNRRPYAIMINNHHSAWPQSGLQDAYLIYEIMVEGGITRMLALFTQDKDISKIGSIRSARHNYLDYAMENDAIYVHFGWSYLAEEQIPKLGIDHIDGNTFANKYFYRDKTLNRSTEHTVFTTSDNIKKAIKDYNYRNERNKDYLLNYTKSVNLDKILDSKVANNVTIKYSYYQTSSYEYNASEGVYYRFMGNKAHTDLVTGEQYKFKNIIVYDVKYNTYPDKLQDLQNIGSGNGYYITNGYAVPITWEKLTREGETTYKYQDGTEIEVADGNTFIQIYPSNGGSLVIN